LLATGPFDDDDLGVSCYHAKTGAVELYLNHLVDGPGEYVVVDCTAGADSFASGLFTRFDLTVLVAEPTRKGISVYRQWRGYAEGFDVTVALVGNKVQTPEDLTFLRSQAGEEPLAWIGHEPAVRAMEQGRPFSLGDLSPETAAALWAIKSRLDATSRDWARYTSLAARRGPGTTTGARRGRGRQPWHGRPPTGPGGAGRQHRKEPSCLTTTAQPISGSRATMRALT
jgi:CO dehydrogenase maturation factor